ncbi:MAG: hypothetical protein IPN85_18295 [Flavobacteriales bacterium]|nr:hypothetical protein [Flavobacteriales bacterium]
MTTATVELFDLLESKVAMHTVPMNGNTLQHLDALHGALADGLYVVNVTVG